MQRQLGRANDAVNSFERALALNPKLPRLGEELLNTWSLAASNEQAIAVYERIRNIVPDTAGLHVAVANIHAERFLLDDAVTHFERALRLDSNSAPVHANYAVICGSG